MKKLVLFFPFLFLFTSNSLAQKATAGSKKELLSVLSDFMNCIIKKDSIKFYSLFYDGPVTWVGVFKDKSQQQRIEKDSTRKNNCSQSDYKRFYRSISNEGLNEEKFYNIDIKEDGYVASVIFDYSFWNGGGKKNWGKESWGLVKANGQWKITSVIFSMEFESVLAEPKR